ncbi:MAG: FIST C-terminal domain-containing protein [Gammaproteobacteria bacterium]|nr:FIST C-terminal domain-containing protein [Gammaproteobacteria bacterium]
MHLAIERSGDFAHIATCVHNLAQQEGMGSLLILTADQTKPEAWNDLLASLPIPAFGGRFPGIIAQAETLQQGAICLGLPCAPHFIAIPSLNDAEMDLHALLRNQIHDQEAKLAIVLVDGWAHRIDELVDVLFDHVGMSLPILGGGTGLLQKNDGHPSLITPWGMQTEGSLIALLDLPASVGSRHGWQAIAGPFEVTAAEGHVILGLDWQAALDVYRSVVEPHAGHNLDPEHFFDLAKAYPFGMARLDAEFVVRDPVRIEQGHGLRCVGEVPTGSLVHILHGHPDVLIEAAYQARHEAEQRLPKGVQPQIDLVFDCISRALFLGNRYANELAVLNSGQRPLIGALTLGEIAGHGSNYLEFHNKTTTIALLGEAA